MTNDIFDKLRELQDILAEKNKLEAEIADLPKMLHAQEALLVRYKEAFIKKDAEYKEVQQEINTLKAQLDETERKRTEAEAAMDDISTQREYDALDKEIQDAKKREEELRTELLRADTHFKKLDDAIKTDQSEIAQQEEDIRLQKERIDSDLNKKKQEISQLQQEEDRLSPNLDSDTLFKFERIIKSKQGIGIVPVQGSVCTGCHMILPAQFAIEVREGKNIMYCPYCSRILYFEEHDTTEMAFFDEGDMGSLADLLQDDAELEE